MPTDQSEKRTIEEKMAKLKVDLHNWIKSAADDDDARNALANELDSCYYNLSIVGFIGGVISTVGGFTSSAGLVATIFKSRKASWLLLTGASISFVGLVSLALSDLLIYAKAQEKETDCKKIHDKYNDNLMYLRTECVELTALLDKYGNMDENFSEWMTFWYILTTRKDAYAIKRNVFYSEVIAKAVADAHKNSNQPSVYGTALGGAAQLGTGAGSVARAADKFVERRNPIAGNVDPEPESPSVLSILSGVLGLMSLPFTILNTIMAVKVLYYRKTHYVSDIIREKANQLKISIRTNENVDHMIEKTMQHVN